MTFQSCPRMFMQLLLLWALSGFVVTSWSAGSGSDYEIKPGDTLIVSVWKEQDLTMEALVRPDGKFSFSLAGDVQASGSFSRAGPPGRYSQDYVLHSQRGRDGDGQEHRG